MSQPSDAVQNEGVSAGGTTPVPNELLDRTMPALRDTELRVLLVVVRQTLGWQASPGSPQRKDRDWLTQSQLMWRTGRASGAVSRAVDALVQAGLVSVTDRAGMPVRTPAERRRHLGHLYYQLGADFRDASRLPKIEHAKAHTTKEIQIQKYKAKRQNVDNSGEKPLAGKPFVVRPKGWQRVTRPSGSSTSLPSGMGREERD